MKKALSLVLVFALCLSLFACSENCSHEYVIKNQTPSSCTAIGRTLYSCNKCKSEYSIELPKVAHSYAAATCSSPMTCTVCGATEGSTLNHNYSGFLCTYCGAENTIFTIPSEGYDGSAVTITFYHTMGAVTRQVLDVHIAEFNKLYPNITVVHELMGNYEDVHNQIKTELNFDMHPNIAYCFPEHAAQYNDTNAIISLDDLIASDITVARADGTTEIMGLTATQKADFIDGFYHEGREFGDGKMYTLPFSKSTEVLYYNKTFFEKNELTVPTTWDEMEKVCEQIKEIDPTCIPLGYDSESNWFITMCEQLGSDYTSATGEHYLFNNDTNKEFVKRFREWYQKEYVTTQETYGAYTSGLFTATTGQRCYMCIASSAGAKYQQLSEEEVGIVTIPQVNTSNPKVISQGPSICIFKDANPQEVVASWLFVKFLTTNSNFQAAFAATSGYMPVIKSAAEHPVYKAILNDANGFDNISSLSAKIALKQMNACFSTPAFIGSAKARDEVGSLIQAAFIGDASNGVDALIDKAFQDAINNCPH